MLTTQQQDFGRGTATWIQNDAEGDTLHFAAANGFPVGSYDFFLNHFKHEFNVVGLENRGAWDDKPPQRRFSWHHHADDLIAFLDYRRKTYHCRPVIAMGHSIGGTVSALAAAKRPDLFKALIMFDPATTPGRLFSTISAIAPAASFTLLAKTNLVKRTRGRTPLWESKEAFINYHRKKATYRNFSEVAFDNYAQAGLVAQSNGQFSLRYSREWEAHNFQHTFSPWQALRSIEIPTLVLRAEHSYLHKKADFKRNMRRMPPLISHGVIRGAGHMALQEDCEQVVQISYDWLRKNGLLSASPS
jgi:pimeloyl-ACP methyl ester carboxylesterase